MVSSPSTWSRLLPPAIAYVSMAGWVVPRPLAGTQKEDISDPALSFSLYFISFFLPLFSSPSHLFLPSFNLRKKI